MKKIAKYSLIAFIATTFATSCTPEELMDWQGGENVYFTHLLAPGMHMRLQDFVELRFSFMAPDVESVLVPLSVTTTGTFTDYDREVAFEIGSILTIDGEGVGTLVEGTHFDIESSIIRAGRVEDTLWIRFHRTADLQVAGKMGFWVMTLMPNHHFGTDFQYTRDAPNQSWRWLLSRHVGITDDIVRPQFWSYEFFGAYSADKFRVIGIANNMPLAFLDGAVWNDVVLTNSPLVLNPWFLALAHTTQYWLDANNDPDNPTWTEINEHGQEVPMSMGPNIVGN